MKDSLRKCLVANILICHENTTLLVTRIQGMAWFLFYRFDVSDETDLNLIAFENEPVRFILVDYYPRPLVGFFKPWSLKWL